MTIEVQEVKSFIEDAKRFRSYWYASAKASWDELKRRPTNQKLWTNTPNFSRKRVRYPAWYSIFKIRQPLLLSRTGIPICKDTTQDGNDTIGATAAILKERLAISLAKDFDFFDVLASSRDDFLATNFGFARAYYERKVIKEKVKERLIPQQLEGGEEVVFMNASGQVVEADGIMQDDEGFFLEHEEVVDVEDEKICLKPVLYKEALVEPDVRRWSEVKRLAFMTKYSPQEFKHIFGEKAYLQLPSDQEVDDAAAKRRYITVYEYWDKFEKRCYWYAENSDEFITPKDYYLPDDAEEDDKELNGLYNLSCFFPCPEPMIMNQATDEFWPDTEYAQIVDILDDIHQIFGRMASATRAIRTRLLFDANVDGLQPALNEANEGDAFGVPNLAQSLNAAGGTLAAVVQYIPTEPVIECLQQLYQALEQRLNTVYKLTGTSDLLQGLITDPTQRTFGERQMTEKYALNQLADPQRKMQIFVRDCYELMCEMALKNFKDESLAKYINPNTLQPEDRQRYAPALGMLKDNNKRFRIELETDSTIALNEEYDKQIRIELVNTLTTALEKTANIAQTSPALVVTELHCLKHLIQSFRQGKMFQSEVTQAIDNVIKSAEAATAPAFNKDEAALALRREELAAQNQLKQYEIQSTERLEMAKLQQADAVQQIQVQLESLKTQQEQIANQSNLQMQYEKLQSDIALQMQELALKREEIAVKMQELVTKNELAQVELAIEGQKAQAGVQYDTVEQQLEQADLQLRATQQELEQQRADLELQERFMTEQRLQSEQKLSEVEAQLRHAAQVKEIMTPAQSSVPLIPRTIKKKTKVTRKEGEGEVTIEKEEEI